jgi:membrane protease YdiL (CAAX protease family)
MGESQNQPGGISLPASDISQASQPSTPGARPGLALLAYFAAVFIGGALLAPLLYDFVVRMAPGSNLATKPFHRYLDRSLMVVALIGLWPLLRSLSVGSPLALLRPAGLGAGRRLTRGAVVGFVSLAVVGLIATAASAHHFQIGPSAGRDFSRIASAAATAMAVAVIEEFLFRGAIFGGMRRVWPWATALLVSSVIYAAVHFLQKTDLTGAVTWHSGLDLLPQMFAAMANPALAIPTLLNLTLAGIILAVAYQRTGDLYFSIGLHGGWVFWWRIYAMFSGPAVHHSAWFYGTDQVVDGWLACLVLVILLVVLPRLARSPALAAQEPRQK